MGDCRQPHVDAAPLHVDEQLTEVAVVATVEIPHGEFGKSAVERLGSPKHFAEKRFELFAHVPRGFGVERRVIDPCRSRGGAALEVLGVRRERESDDDGGNVDGFALHAVALDVGLSEDLFVGTLADVELFGEAF